MTIGVSSRAEVTASTRLRAAFTKPVCSATPTPSSATSTTPSGAKLVNVDTMLVRKAAISVPLSWLTTRIGSPVAGCTALKSMPDSSQDSSHVTISNRKNSAAGSGSLLPTRSIAFRLRSSSVRCPGNACCVCALEVVDASCVASGLLSLIPVYRQCLLIACFSSRDRQGRLWPAETGGLSGQCRASPFYNGCAIHSPGQVAEVETALCRQPRAAEGIGHLLVPHADQLAGLHLAGHVLDKAACTILQLVAALKRREQGVEALIVVGMAAARGLQFGKKDL